MVLLVVKIQRVLALLFVIFSAVGHAHAVTQTLVSSPTPPVLLEVYSSQGCSSCPPAQAWVNQYKQSDALWSHVIPMVFHVDYWDYLGWKDPFASRANSNRQRNHKRQGNINAVYTPGFVVNGEEWTGWFRGKSLPSKKGKQSAPTTLIATLNTEGVSATFKDQQGTTLDATFIHIARLGFDVKTPVRRGENARRTLAEEFIVLGVNTFPFNENEVYSWPQTSFDGDTQAVVVWLSDQTQLQPIHAVGGFINPSLIHVD
jgi:hypothetical protein